MRLITSVNTEQLQTISSGVADTDNLDSTGATAGQVLTADGAGGAVWVNAPSGGGSGSFITGDFSVTLGRVEGPNNIAETEIRDTYSLANGTDWSWVGISDSRFAVWGDPETNNANKTAGYCWCEQYDPVYETSLAVYPLSASTPLLSDVTGTAININLLGNVSIFGGNFEQLNVPNYSLLLGNSNFTDADSAQIVLDGSETTLGDVVTKINNATSTAKIAYLVKNFGTGSAITGTNFTADGSNAYMSISTQLTKAALDFDDEVLFQVFSLSYGNEFYGKILKGTPRFAKLVGPATSANSYTLTVLDSSDQVVGSIVLSVGDPINGMSRLCYITCIKPTLSFEDYPGTSVSCIKCSIPNHIRCSGLDELNAFGVANLSASLLPASHEFATYDNREFDEGQLSVFDIVPGVGIKRVGVLVYPKAEVYYPQVVKISESRIALYDGDYAPGIPGARKASEWINSITFINIAEDGTPTIDGDPLIVGWDDRIQRISLLPGNNKAICSSRSNDYNPNTSGIDRNNFIALVDLDNRTVIDRYDNFDYDREQLLGTSDIGSIYNNHAMITDTEFLVLEYQKFSSELGNNTKIYMMSAAGDVLSKIGPSIALTHFDDPWSVTANSSLDEVNGIGVLKVNQNQVLVFEQSQISHKAYLVEFDVVGQTLTVLDTYDFTHWVTTDRESSQAIFSRMYLEENRAIVATLQPDLSVGWLVLNTSNNKISLEARKTIVGAPYYDKSAFVTNSSDILALVKLSDTNAVLGVNRLLPSMGQNGSTSTLNYYVLSTE